MTSNPDPTAAFAKVERDWEQLASEGAISRPYFSLAWLRQWVLHCRPVGDLWIRSLDEGDTIAALAVDRILGAQVLRPIGTGESDYTGLPSRRSTPEAWSSLGSALARDPSWSLLHLHSVSDPDEIIAGLASHLPGRPIRRTYDICPRIDVDRSWEELLKSRNRDFRKSAKRWVRRAEGFGAVSLEILTPPVDAALIDELENIERQSWKWEKGNATFRSPRQRSFLTGLLTDPTMDLDLWLLKFDGALAAFAVVLKGAGEWFYYLSTYSEKYAHTGAFLLSEIVKAACASPECRHVNLLRGRFQYKTAWTSDAEEVHEIVWPRGFRGRVLAWGHALRWRAAESERLQRLRSRLLGVGDRRDL